MLIAVMSVINEFAALSLLNVPPPHLTLTAGPLVLPCPTGSYAAGDAGVEQIVLAGVPRALP